MNTENSCRLNGFNWLRFWAIIAVVCIHSSDVALRKNHYFPVLTFEGGCYYVFSACLRFCVPVFLMMAAFLSERKWQAAQDVLPLRWKRYAIPLVAASVFYTLVVLAQAKVAHQPVAINGGLLFVILIGRAYYHTWFLFNLLVYAQLHPLLRRLATPPALALGACIILPAFANPAWIDRLLHERLPHDTQAFWMGQWLFWEYLVFGAAYYTLGIWAANHAAWLQTQSKRALHALIVSGLLACSWYGLALRVSAFFACGSLLLSLAVFCLALQTTRPPPLWIMRIGGLSLGIYLWHPFVLLLLRIGEGRLYREAVSPTITFAVMAMEILGALAGSYGIALVLTRLRPLRGLAQ